ncbi:ABC transporter ATP-binding protein [Oceanidesulfovibrio marinus]|uniref:ABC transporter ATP-binding protein n=1 Tax=Oceanidesulfovibrio marinus TaxID=370038 RepID=A0A6P1ZIR2_9BACT|nr:ATP-binding cassette domain-containing protein [Oceanidesulfovibrio marinus]QJT11196.1 ATP-binding cassette domain-containing protein [Oceanidesulfovibrio marinus]TVM34708.1 ABC transporter ATP-binding protein [Oceanidesulfovibrio marinus]
MDSWDITLNDLTLGYGETVVLESVSDVLPAGKTSVILGGSGCGKSTLLKHILGLMKPMKGRILIGGNDLFSLPHSDFRSIRRRMGVLFQDGALLGSLTLAENVALPLKEHTRMKDKEIAEKVHSKLELVGLDEFGGYYPSELSGGMKKRGGLARSIVNDPPLLLCDEPTSGLDPVNAATMDRMLKRMQQRLGSTMVVVSHDLASLHEIADHVLVLNEGRVAYAGDLAGMESSNDPYLRRFLAREPEPENTLD